MFTVSKLIRAEHEPPHRHVTKRLELCGDSKVSAPNPVLPVVSYKRERDVGVSLARRATAIRSCRFVVRLIAAPGLTYWGPPKNEVEVQRRDCTG